MQNAQAAMTGGGLPTAASQQTPIAPEDVQRFIGQNQNPLIQQMLSGSNPNM
jgi:hypothetical protein